MLNRSIAALQKGGMIIVHDGSHREGEADLMFHASFATPQKIQALRKDAGGLICLASDNKTMESIGLAYLADIYAGSKNIPVSKSVISKTPYGDKSAFSISINHRKTYTGITDNDRTLTILEFSKLAADGKFTQKNFTDNFYSPGHVPLLFSRGLDKRKGHTELSIRLCELASLPPAIVICEMLGLGKALSVEQAKAYAQKNNIPFLEYSDIPGAME